MWQLATLAVTETAQNAVFIDGPGTGKTHLATAIAVPGIAAMSKRVRFYSAVVLVNLLEREKREGKAQRSAQNKKPVSKILTGLPYHLY